MDHRLELHEKLKQLLLDAGETPHVYFQPPESIKMQYPCFLYDIDDFPSILANDSKYLVFERYTVVYIDRKATSPIPKTVSLMKGFGYDRHYVADNLHHHVFTFMFT